MVLSHLCLQLDAELQKSRIEVQGLRVALSHLQKENNTLIHEKVEGCMGVIYVFEIVCVVNVIYRHFPLSFSLCCNSSV